MFLNKYAERFALTTSGTLIPLMNEI